jgi:PAS domain S-box-containing protein
MLLTAALMVVAIVVLSYQNSRYRAAAQERLVVTQQVQDATDDLLSSLKDAETGQRGYILTGTETYLEPYSQARADIPGILGKLRAATDARPDEAERAKALEPLVTAKLKELAETIELRRSRGFSSANQVVETGRGKALMDDIRARCRVIREVADRRAAELSAAAEKSASRLAFVTIAGSLILLGFLGLSAITIFRGLALRENLYHREAATAEFLRVTLLSIGDAVIATDAASNITLINPVAEKLTGWPENEALGKRITEVFRLVNETTRAQVENPLEKALATGAIVGLANHTVLISRDGAEIPLDDSGAPIRNDAGSIIGAVLVFRDVSARRQSERQLQESNEQLKQFAGAAAHDLRSPLNSVNAVAQLLAVRFASQLGSEGSELLGYITSGTQRMSRLLEDLLAYAQASHFEPEEGKRASMDYALQTVLENLRTNVESTGARVEAGPLPVVAAHETHVVQLFQNLIGNALKYRSESLPRIRITAEKNGDQWVIGVNDNGIGIEPQYTDQIFKPFKRLHGGEHPGSGIGLATCEKIVAGYGGRIWVESTPGNGSTFYFTIPAANETLAANAAPS